MLGLSSLLVLLIGVGIFVQWWGVARYLNWFRGYQPLPVDDQPLPKAAIILSIRGAAPFLSECLSRLATQNFPDYRIFLVVDHPTDPAKEIIENWQAKGPPRPVSISFLENPSPNAYLKTSAVLQAIRNLDNNVGAVVIADADTLAYPNWLRDLVTPLLSSKVGLVSGNRWYDPTTSSWGALCRFFYNAICVVPMYFIEATWGGSLSIKREVFATDLFCQKMADTPCEDAAIQASAKHVNLLLEMQPDVMMFNLESCSLREAFDFIKRQLLWTRLYHPAWNLLLLVTWGVHLLLAGAMCGGAYHLAIGSTSVGVLLLVGVAAQIVAALLFAEQLHNSISQKIHEKQGLELPSITWPARLRLLLVLPLAFEVTCYAMLAAALSSRVTWSGITYQVVPPHSLRMIEYLPFQKVPRQHSQSEMAPQARRP